MQSRETSLTELQRRAARGEPPPVDHVSTDHVSPDYARFLREAPATARLRRDARRRERARDLVMVVVLVGIVIALVTWTAFEIVSIGVDQAAAVLGQGLGR